MTARDVARKVLDRVARGDAWVNLTLDGELARSGLALRDRALATELVYGVVRHQPRLDRALAALTNLARTPARARLAMRVAAYQILFLRVPAYAAVDDAVNAIRFSAGDKVAGFANAVLRKLAAQGEPALPTDPRARVEIEHSLPAWIVDELARVVPLDELAATAAGFAEIPRLAIRVNLRRVARAELLTVLAADGFVAEVAAGTQAGAFVDGLGDPSVSPSFRAGLFTVQDVGAQLVGEACAPQAGERVLDACAGVGGKSTHLAELADDGGHIDAVDRSATKLRLASETAARLGLRSITAHIADLLVPTTGVLADRYHRVVLDAPCSGLGVMRRHPESKWRLQPGDVVRMAAVQAQLLDGLAPRVAPGGLLVYSVCTFTAAEGPDQVAAFIARHPDFAVEHHAQTWPHRDHADAFYLATLRRATAP